MALKSVCLIDFNYIGPILLQSQPRAFGHGCVQASGGECGSHQGSIDESGQKTARLNKGEIEKGLVQAGFGEPKRSSLTALILLCWSQCLNKSRNTTTGLPLTAAEKGGDNHEGF